MFLRLITRQWIGLVALTVALGGVTAAATGQFATLGTSNVADKTTSFANTGNGPALALAAEAGPPLSVASTALVPKLNASLLRGRAPNAFLPSAGSQLLALDGLATTPTGASYQRGFVAPASGSMHVFVSGMCRVDDANRLQLVLGTRRGESGEWQTSEGSQIGEHLNSSEPVLVGCTAQAVSQVSKGERLSVRLVLKRTGGGAAAAEAMSVFVWFDERTLH